MPGNDSNTKSLLHLDGSDASTTITDSNIGGSAHTWTCRNAAALSTAQAEFGSASLRVATSNGDTSSRVDTPDSSDFDFGSGNFTVDFWIRWNSSADDATFGYALVWQWTTGTKGWRFGHFNGSYQFDWTTDGSTAKSATWSDAIATGSWIHIALVRNGSNIDVYKNGTALTRAGTNISTDTIFNSSTTVGVGGAPDGSWGSVNGWLDEVRVSKVARWTSNFTAPSAAYAIDYSLTAAFASFVLTGIAATLAKTKLLVAAVATFTLTGQAVRFPKIYFPASRATFTLTGQAVSFPVARKVIAAMATFVLTGRSATLKSARFLVASRATFVLTGVATYLVRIVAPASKFKLRLIAPSLKNTRANAPSLED